MATFSQKPTAPSLSQNSFLGTNGPTSALSHVLDLPQVQLLVPDVQAAHNSGQGLLHLKPAAHLILK